MKPNNLQNVPVYSREDIPKSILHEADSSRSVVVQPLGWWKDTELVMPIEKGEEEMLNTESEYVKLQLPPDFVSLLKKLGKSSNANESDIVRKGLIFVGLADKVKQQGLKLAVVDDDGNLVANLEGY